MWKTWLWSVIGTDINFVLVQFSKWKSLRLSTMRWDPLLVCFYWVSSNDTVISPWPKFYIIVYILYYFHFKESNCYLALMNLLLGKLRYCWLFKCTFYDCTWYNCCFGPNLTEYIVIYLSTIWFPRTVLKPRVSL